MQVIRAYPRHLSLAVPLFDQYRQFYNRPPDSGGARQFLSDRLESGDSAMFLAVEGSGSHETGLGFLHLYPIFSSIHMKPSWFLSDLFVLPSARRQGVAKALLERAHRLAVETRACELILQTGITNAPAQSLYESLGYQRNKEFHTYTVSI